MEKKAERIQTKSKMSKSLQSALSCFSGLGFKTSQSGGAAIIEHVDSQDLGGRPVLYWKISLFPDGFELEYSAPPEKNPKTLKLKMLAILLDALSLCDCYSLSSRQVHSLFRQPLEEAGRALNPSQESFAGRYEKAEAERKRLSIRCKKLSELLEKESGMRMELEKNNSSLKSRLGAIDGISASELENELYSWIKVHGGKIRVKSFAQAHAVSELRVEEGLEALLRGGYIAKKE